MCCSSDVQLKQCAVQAMCCSQWFFKHLLKYSNQGSVQLVPGRIPRE
jgi:hypothetical protein